MGSGHWINVNWFTKNLRVNKSWRTFGLCIRSTIIDRFSPKIQIEFWKIRARIHRNLNSKNSQSIIKIRRNTYSYFPPWQNIYSKWNFKWLFLKFFIPGFSLRLLEFNIFCLAAYFHFKCSPNLVSTICIQTQSH